MSSIVVVIVTIVAKTLVPSLFKVFFVKIIVIQGCFVLKKKPKYVMSKITVNIKISTGPLPK